MTTALVNLDPVLHIAAMGVAVAVGPLAWWVLRQRRPATPLSDARAAAQRLRALTLLLLFFTLDLIVFGAFTRLSDSGLGCPDWPGCYGHPSPLGAHPWIRQAEALMPSGPVTRAKAWIEMLHRYLATGVGVVIVTLLAAHAHEARQQAKAGQIAALPSLGWPLALLAVVCLQGAFGALTVTMKLFPAIVTLHLLGALLLLGLMAVLASRYDRAAQPVAPAVQAPGQALGAGSMAVTALLVLQVASGGWVSTNYAVLACAEFPLCQGVWWPEMDFGQGLTLWRELGQTPQGLPITLAALTAIHVVHRLLACATLAALGWLAWRWHGAGLREGRWLGALAVLQALTGLTNVVLQWPMVAALLHTAGAAAMLALLVWVQAHTHRTPSHPAPAVDAA